MKYVGYKFKFNTSVHFGNNHLDEAGHFLYADTIFSALCHEAVDQGGNELLENLVNLVSSGKIKLSDAFPYNKKTYYVPKPMIHLGEKNIGNSMKKKAVKKLDYIPINELDNFIDGVMDLDAEAHRYSEMGIAEVRTMVAIDEGLESKPYSVGAYNFRKDWGLYLIIGYIDHESLEIVENLLLGLEYSGIGGKRSSGFGKFTLLPAKLPDELILSIKEQAKEGHKYMTLSISMAEDDELESVLNGANYSLIRRSGFISSLTYANRLIKKKDVYLFKAGSVFCYTFEKKLLDVSGDGAHKVYRYANPIFLEVK